MPFFFVLFFPLTLSMNNYAPPGYTPNYSPYQNYRSHGCSTCPPPINRRCPMGIQCPTAFPQQPCPPCPTPPSPTICENIACPIVTCPPYNKSENSVKYENAKIALATVKENYKDEELKFRQRVTRRLHTRAHATPILSLIMRLENKCNQEELKRIMQESINNNIVSAKIAIVERASREIGGQFDVVCTNGIFSYYAVARMFCEVTVNDISCFAFRHDDIAGQIPSIPIAELEDRDKAADIPTRDPTFSVLDETKTIMSRPSHPILSDSDVSKGQRIAPPSVDFMPRVGPNVVDMFDRSLQVLTDVNLEEFPLPENNQQHISVDPNLQNLREESMSGMNKNKVLRTVSRTRLF